MKRLKGLFDKVIDMNNLELADKIASKGKSKQYGVIAHNRNKETNLQALQRMLIDKTYHTSQYSVFKVYEPKERDVYRLPYFPDRILHHAIMKVLEYPVFVSTFTADTYSCIKGRGIHKAANNVRKALRDKENTTYCLKLDIKKFYPSVDHDILKQLIRKKIKDKDMLWLLDEIIDSASGVPIGNYLSQYLANFYMTYFDHWIKQEKKLKYYFRYADDIVILSNSKEYLHQLLSDIKEYLDTNLKLTVKNNYQIFPVQSRGIDFLGYVFRHGYTRLRKSIKQNFARALVKRKGPQTIAAYNGWTKHCNSKHLMKKLLNGTTTNSTTSKTIQFVRD